MAQKLAGGNGAIALLCNTLPTGAILVVLILIFGPVSGAHFNPAVSVAFALRGELPWPHAALYIVAQIIGGVIGVWAVHVMFDLPIWQFSTTVRTGPSQWFAEFVATFGLVLTILGCVARNPVPHRMLWASTSRRPIGSRLDIVREPCRHDRPGDVGHVRRDRASRSVGVHRRADDGDGRGPVHRGMVVGKSGHRPARLPCPLGIRSRTKTHYSITSSARANTEGGTVMPSALAVLILNAISNLVNVLPATSKMKFTLIVITTCDGGSASQFRSRKRTSATPAAMSALREAPNRDCSRPMGVWRFPNLIGDRSLKLQAWNSIYRHFAHISPFLRGLGLSRLGNM